MKNRIPARTYEINLTNKCNLACKYCFEKDKGICSMNAEDLKDILQNPLTSSLYLFGGEPMMNAPFHTDAFNLINDSTMPTGLKEALWRSAASTTTNGTELLKHKDMVKDLGLRIQVSIDGPKEIHDENRVYTNGKGSFDKVMESVSWLRENKLPFYLHGVVSKNTVKDLFIINKFFFEQEEITHGTDVAIKTFSTNAFMFVIEDDYTDEDIDEAINQYSMLIDWLEEKLPEDKYKECLLALASKRGSMCGAGHNTLVLGADGNIYPCHRGNGQDGTESHKFTMGDSFSDTPKNLQIYNNYFRNRSLSKTTTCFENPIFWGHDLFTPQVNFCPATFKEVCDTVNYMPPKYFIFMMELGNFLMGNAIEAGFTIDDIKNYSQKGKVKVEKETETE